MNINKVVPVAIATVCAASSIVACGTSEEQSARAVQSNEVYGQPTLDGRVSLVSDDAIDMNAVAGTDFGYEGWLAPGSTAPYGTIGGLPLGGKCLVTVSDSVNPGDGLYEVSVEDLSNESFFPPESGLPRSGVMSYIKSAEKTCI